MMERKILGNLACGFLAIVICVLIWQIIGGPGPPFVETSSPTDSEVAYSLRTANSSIYTHPMHTLPEDDYIRLVNISSFSFNLISNVCNSSDILLLVLIHTSPGNFAKRRTIRETWGQRREKLRVVFMVGLVQHDGLQKLLKEESETYHDIAQGNFVDAYRNMTYKHVTSLKYAIYHCPQTKYVLKTDDDVFVNMPSMMQFLNGVLSPYGANDLLLCVPFKNAKVLRSYRSKWRVSFSEYPKREYPTYCPGWAIMYSPDVLFALYREAQMNEYFWIDDVHITGTLVEKVHVVHTNVIPLVLSRQNVDEVTINRNFVSVSKMFLYGWPNLSEKEIRALWDFATANSSDKTDLK